MMWFYVTVVAVIFQTCRHAIQKHLTNKLSTISIGWARIIFLFPFLICVLIYCYCKYESLYSLSWYFYLFCFFAGLNQMLGTLCLVELFSLRNFSIGVTYMKTDTIQISLFAFLFLGESLSYHGVIGLFMSIVGILLLSPIFTSGKFELKDIFDKSALLGMSVGFFFSIGSVLGKKAMLLFGGGIKLLPVVMVFSFYTVIQNFMYLAYTWYKGVLRSTVSNILKHYKACSAVGLLSMFGACSWLLAFSMQKVTYVTLVGQIEILISLFISKQIFSETQKLSELVGIVLIVFSVVVLVV
jgi:drug/metabolite transporter (DMT)-like permease